MGSRKAALRSSSADLSKSTAALGLARAALVLGVDTVQYRHLAVSAGSRVVSTWIAGLLVEVVFSR